MVGALTVMVVILAVFLAYNANNGLPFVPSYRLSVEVPDADLLVPSNEVRIGGVRVGMIEEIQPQQDENGEVSARLDLKLDKDVEELPVDSTVVVRARSALGLKYLEIDQGDSDKGYAPGATIPISHAHPTPVEIDEVLSTFDAPTRRAIQAEPVRIRQRSRRAGTGIERGTGAAPGRARAPASR